MAVSYLSVGSTAHFTYFYDTTLGATGATVANNMKAVAESDATFVRQFFGGATAPWLPNGGKAGVYFINDTNPENPHFGAAWYTPGAHTLTVNVTTTDAFDTSGVRNEWVHECTHFMQDLQNKGLLSSNVCESHAMAIDREYKRVNKKAADLKAGGWAQGWLNSSRTDFVNHPDPDGWTNVGCDILFLHWLHEALGFTWTQITKAGASSYRTIYKTLTGKTTDPFPTFKAQLDRAFPPAQAANLNGFADVENPYPLTVVPPPAPTPSTKSAGNWPLFSEVGLIVGDGQSRTRSAVNTGKTEQAVFRQGQWVEFWSRPNGGSHAPVADFTWAQSVPSSTTADVFTGIEALSGPQSAAVTVTTYTISFSGLASFEIGGRIVGYAWDFGDGTTGTGATVNHVYTGSQTRTVKLTVTDALGATATVSRPVTISGGTPTSTPVANFSPTVNGYTIAFDGSKSSSTNGATITGWSWDFGDGTSAVGPTTSHTYKGGSYTVTLTVTDSYGQTASSALLVQTSNQTPVPQFSASATGLVLTVDGSGSIDPDGTITAYAWSFGDGATGSGVTATHSYGSAGTYTVILTVTDNSGAQTATNKAVTLSTPATDYIIGAAQASSTLVPASNAATLQDFARSPDTGEFYSTQVHPESDGAESVRLSRMAANGSFLDQMLLTRAGHGTTFALEYTGGKMYIWLNWNKATDGVTSANDLVRFPYTPGTYTRSQVPGFQVKIPGPTYNTVQFDFKGGYATIRDGSGSTDVHKRYPIANVLAGNLTGQVGATISIPQGSSDPTMQGFTTYYDSLFRYTGVRNDNSRYSVDKPTITEYSWSTGKVVRTIDASAFGSSFSIREPEGLSIYNTGTSPVLFFAMTTGPTGGPHTYLTWWYPLYNPDTVVTPPQPQPPPQPPPPTGNAKKNPWINGSETEGLPSTVKVVKWADIATSASDNNNPNVALNRLTANAVVDISGEQLFVPNFGSNTSIPTAITAPHFLGFIGGVNNGVFDNQVTLRANVLNSAQLAFIAAQTKNSNSDAAVIRPTATFSNNGAPSYFMGVHFVGADQGKVTEQPGAQFSPAPARYRGLDLGVSGPNSILQNCLLQGFGAADGNTPPWEIGAVNMRRTTNFIVRRVEVDGQLPVGSPSRPTSGSVDPYGWNWKRSGGLQWNAETGPKMYDFSIHSGLVSGLTYSVAGTSNNGSNNTRDIYVNGLYVEDQSLKGFSGINFEDVLSSIYLENITIKMNGTGGEHLKLNPYLQAVQAPNLANWKVVEPTWSGLGNNGMFTVGIAKWGTMQKTAPTVIKNGVQLTATTSTTADPTRYYHIQAL